MIELTVKTLDSQNHQFTVEDDITVEQFKVHIAEQVNIPAATQRIIYCGRVLQDNDKLADYDVNGKVVHLVQRPPPGANNRPNRSASPPQESNNARRGGFRAFDRGNTMYVGSMAFPGNLMESQGIVPPPPTHSLSGSRLNVARRMLRRAEAVIRLLENPSGEPEQPPIDEIQEEEVTPVIEARVIVPNNNAEPIDEAAVISAVQNTLLNASGGPINLGQTVQPNLSVPASAAAGNQSGSMDSTPEETSARSSPTENAPSADVRPDNNALPENASRGIEMSELLTMLAQLQTRFAPFLERYQNFMREDPEVSTDDQRNTQTMLNRVSEVLHFLGHAYHSLSDIIIRVRNPPPRPLLCRPILIQHSAVVQAGIPIQVEAQINLHADRPPTITTSNASSNTASSQNTATATSASTGATNTTTGSAPNAAPGAAPTMGAANGGVGPTLSGFVGLPFMPSGSMRVITTPVEIHTVRANHPPRRPNNNNNTVNTPAAGATPTAPPPPSDGPPTTSASTNAGATPPPHAAPGNDAFNNSNVEFFMEVTPEGITIDSLETALVGSNQAANEFLRGALNGPPPEFLQSLMQIVNSQIINRAGAQAQGHDPPPPYTAASATIASATSTNATESTQSSAQNQPANGQNSQARGNTATNPTTATHTRSTPRPHVHMTQQAMQGGFDPFLPCNSHHISRRRHHIVATAAAAPSMGANAARQDATAAAGGQDGESRRSINIAASSENVRNFISGVLNSWRAVNFPSQSTSTAPSAPPNPTTTSSGDSQATGPQIASLFASLSSNVPDLLSNPTIDQLLQHFHQDQPHIFGENIFTDIVMTLVRNLTMVDLFQLNAGNLEPLDRNRPALREYVRTELCGGDTSPEGARRATDLLMIDLNSFVQAFSVLPTRDDIDITRSMENFLRSRLPSLVGCVLNPNNPSIRELLEQLIATAKQLLALILRASASGPQGVETIFEQVVAGTLNDIPADLRVWTLSSSRSQIRNLMTNLPVPPVDVERYVIRKSHVTSATPDQPETRQNDLARSDGNLDLTAEVEAMDVEEITPTNEEAPVLEAPPMRVEDPEPLPNVVIGSEPWHAQVPEDWVPIITRDAQKQRRQNPQGPFSDAYLSGMPSKRRKIINNSKPQGSLPQVISDGVRQAVTATGLTAAAPLDTVVTAAGTSPEIQAAYRTLLRTSVQSNLRDNEDFTPDRYPNASNYFNSSSRLE